MDKHPIITVAIITFRRPKLVKRAIQSVLNQTYPHFKICVYDDSSGDETSEVVSAIAETDSRIFYYCNEQNLGVVGNLVRALKNIDTPYFCVLADDDYFLRNHFENVLKGFNQHPEAIFSANQAISLNQNRLIHKVTFFNNCREGLYEPPEGLLYLIKNDPSILPAAVFRKEVLEKVGCYDPELGSTCDWDYAFRIAAEYPYVVNKTPGCVFFVNETGYSGASKSQFLWPQWLKLFQRVAGNSCLSLETKNKVELHLKKRLKRMLVTSGKEAALCGNYSDAGVMAEVLKDFFKSNRHYFKLKTFTVFCKWFPPFRWYLRFYNELRSKRKLENAKLHYAQYLKYASYLQD